MPLQSRNKADENKTHYRCFDWAINFGPDCFNIHCIQCKMTQLTLVATFWFLCSNRPSAALQTPTSRTLPPPSSTHHTLLSRSIHPEHLFTPSSSPHCLAYLPSLSQPSVVMLYRAPDNPDQVPEGQRSPRLPSEEGRKRRREEGEDEETVAKKRGTSALEECDKVRWC